METCANCDNYKECHDGEDYSTDCDGGWVLRKDIEELQGKLKKALDALRHMRHSDLAHAVLWDNYDTHRKWYSVHMQDYIDGILEELR